MKRILISFLISLFALPLWAREGMWIPMFIDRNITEMQQMGFKLSAEDVYSVNRNSMKDAIVQFGGGCTGELISPDGLLITNHHCGYGQIQSHSSLANDYLTNGFWAKSRAEELPNPGLKVSFLIRMEEVTAKVLDGTDSLQNNKDKVARMTQNIAKIKKEAIENTHYQADVKSFYTGNQYFLFVSEVFTDVRLVGAPPSAIGKFGGDTDNWMWPRHTGDFSMFRIYANKDNKPADYAPDNVPYKPRKFFPISLKGVNQGDFTMVFGFPGTTQQYLPAAAVSQIMEQSNPDRIALRDVKLEIIGNAMENDRGIRIQYAAKYASISNAWKKWQGEIKGLKRLDAVNVKLQRETEFMNWVKQSAERQQAYGKLLPQFDSLYTLLAPHKRGFDYYNEVVWRGFDAFNLTWSLRPLWNEQYKNQKVSTATIQKHFRDFSASVDSDVFAALMKKYYSDLPAHMQPKALSAIMSSKNPDKALAKIYSTSLLTDSLFVYELLENPSLLSKLKKDKLFQLHQAFDQVYREVIAPPYFELNDKIESLQQRYMQALLQMQGDTKLFPDANSTLRFTYGKVEGFEPADGVTYKHFTTLEGIMEKDNPEIYDYDVPQALRKLYEQKDYGRYATADGQLPVCFTASNHTTGGNSGSPVIDANGSLIGINFDRCWEGTMSDVMFDPDKCRNISLDMRYMLFIVDKLAGAGYLLEEMELKQ